MFSESVSLQGQPVLRFSRITDDAGRSAEQEFRRKNQPFKHNAVVYVRSGRYIGHGLVNLKDGYPERCPEMQVPVLLENGNTWWYPVEHVEAGTDRAKWPSWIRRRKRVKT
jgi:hypothetical protein